ncbi:MAG: Threonine synthase [Bacteroidetes bacterium]|nr:MAG: Threonine synthase [Bacteroidota bacterium]
MPVSLTCTSCGKNQKDTTLYWRCPCGGLFDLVFEPAFHPKKLAGRQHNLWRYREALPVKNNRNIVSFGEGFTPLLEIGFGDKSAWIKQDQLFPSGSYKDRGSTVLLSHLKETGLEKILEDSSGNAGCSIAAYSALAGIGCDVYVPANASPSKLAQIEAYGARLHRISGSREDVAAAALRAAEKTYYASHCWNPYFFHGTKTFAYEVCEQLGWKAPDTVVLPAGNGTLVIGAYIGFSELKNAGIIRKMPRIVGVQARNCNPISTAWRKDLDYIPAIIKKPTLSEGIAAAAPVRGKQILDCIRKTGGEMIDVPEQTILPAFRELAKKGYFIELTSAAIISGLKIYMRKAGKKELVVSIFTGHGLKNRST